MHGETEWGQWFYTNRWFSVGFRSSSPWLVWKFLWIMPMYDYAHVPRIQYSSKMHGSGVFSSTVWVLAIHSRDFLIKCKPIEPA